MVFEEKDEDKPKDDESHVAGHAGDKHEVPSDSAKEPLIMNATSDNSEEVSEEVTKIAEEAVAEMTEEKTKEV